MKHLGYTLIELLVVVSVLSLLAAFTIPTYQLIVSQLQLSNATEQVADFIRLTEQKTLTEQKVYGVTLTAGSSTIPQFLYDTVTADTTTQTTMTLPTSITVDTVNFASSDIRFATSGAPSVSGYLTIKDSVRNKSRKIEVRPSGAILVTGGEF